MSAIKFILAFCLVILAVNVIVEAQYLTFGAAPVLGGGPAWGLHGPGKREAVFDNSNNPN